jgi:hypothetical protein
MDSENHSQLGCFGKQTLWSRGLLGLLALSTLVLHTHTLASATPNWNKQAAEVCARLSEIPTLVAAGKNKEAKGKLDDTYFADFENVDANLEAEIRTQISRDAAAEIESKFSEIRKAIVKNSSADDLKKQLAALCDNVKSSAHKLKEEKIK